MRNLNSPAFVFVAVLLNLTVLRSVSTCQALMTQEQLNNHTQWMNAWAGWTNAAHNVARSSNHVQMAEAQAKLLTARATMITAIANANKANAEALQGLETARSLALDNRVKKAETFYGKRALHENYKSLPKARPRPTRDDLLRYSKTSAPKPLTPEEFDRIGGEMHWPSLLQRDDFSEHRSQIEKLFVARLDYNQDIHQQVEDLTDGMHARLCSMVREVPSGDYIKARKFIRSLVYESQFDFLCLDKIGNLAAK